MTPGQTINLDNNNPISLENDPGTTDEVSLGNDTVIPPLPEGMDPEKPVLEGGGDGEGAAPTPDAPGAGTGNEAEGESSDVF